MSRANWARYRLGHIHELGWLVDVIRAHPRLGLCQILIELGM
jgi:hypothetical protein